MTNTRNEIKAQMLADVLGYDIVWQKRRER